MSLERRLSRAVAECDLELMEKIFEEIYIEYGKLVAYIISKYVSQKEDIEELTNDALSVFQEFSFPLK